MKEEVNFILREWRLSDKASLAENANNINIWNNVRDYFPHPYTEKDGEEFILMVTNKPGPIVEFAIEIDGKAVGGVGLVLSHDVERIDAEIGYWLGESYWGKGIVTRVVKKMVTYAFENLPLKKIHATVFDYNTASMKVLENNGFEREAILKQAAIKNGKIIDLHYFSLIKKGDIYLKET